MIEIFSERNLEITLWKSPRQERQQSKLFQLENTQKKPFPEASRRKLQQRLNKNPHLRILSDVALVPEEDLKLVYSLVKRLFYQKPFTKHSPGRETQTFS